MASLILVSATGFFWLLTLSSFEFGGSGLLCSLLPIAIGMTYVSLQVYTHGGLRIGKQALNPTADYEVNLPTTFRVLRVGKGFVDFEHPEGGSWSYGISEDLRAVNGLEFVESLGGLKYRMHVNRNSTNAAKVLEAAYQFRTEPKAVEDGVVYLNDCPGYDILLQEATYDYE